jgi:uncharacterized protein
MGHVFPLLVIMALSPSLAQAQLRAEDGLALVDQGDLAGAAALWTPLAARGDVLAQFNMGVLALQGQAGLTPAQAEGFFIAAAQQGHLPAQLALADLAVDRQDWASALDWYRIAANAGYARAQFMAGRIADDGLAGPADAELAAQWYQQAAAQDFAPAQLALGRVLLDRGEAAQGAIWLERAALAGMTDAQFDLAVLLAGGVGVAQDLPAARGWYVRAARAGNKVAMRNLALMQARGLGGPQNFRTALAWALLAGQDATDVAEALREVLPHQAQAQAIELAQTCLTDNAPRDCD